jgi:DNA-binding PadR family transcriptional regulator
LVVLLTSFIHAHILHHTAREPVTTEELAERLAKRGHDLSVSQVNPILNNLRIQGLLEAEKQTGEGRARNLWSATPSGLSQLELASKSVRQLYQQLFS